MVSRNMLVVVSGNFGEQLQEEFADLVVIYLVERLTDCFCDLSREGTEVLGIIDCQVYQFLGVVEGVLVVRIEYFLY